jgi:GT2 family glycosyltransferase
VVIVAFNNLVFNRLCLESLLAHTEYPHYEVVVVDNGSTDGTRGYLRALAQEHTHIRVVTNPTNRGFAPANNQGLAAATGEVLVLLNNDTLVPRGWLTRLARHLEGPALGLVGAVTNRAGNEAQIEAPYRTYGELVRFAEEHARGSEGRLFDIRTATMFCVAMRRDVYEGVGPLDERFQVGLFEDDDFSMRVRQKGYRVVCADDVFVHHFGQASIGKLAATGAYGDLFHANRRRWEEKWGVPWRPYGRRPAPGYGRLTARVREVVGRVVPPGATVVVASKGDDELLRLGGRTAWHFPRTEDGSYAGHYPGDSAAAIAHLEALRRQGAGYLLLPATALWWLEHYRDFRAHLEARYRVAVTQEDTCVIFALDGGPGQRVEGEPGVGPITAEV